MSGNQSRAAFILQGKRLAQQILAINAQIQAYISQNTAVGGDYITNLALADITLASPNTQLTVAQAQAFYSSLVNFTSIRSATDSTTLSNLISNVETLAGNLYSLSPPLALDSLTINMANI